MRTLGKEYLEIVARSLTDEDLSTYTGILRDEQMRRHSIESANRKFEKVKEYVEISGLHFINSETGEILENITIC